VNNLSRLIRVSAGQKLKIYLVSFNGLNSFYNISEQNNVFYINGTNDKRKLSVGFYTNFSDICTNINKALGNLSVTTEPFTNRGVWTFSSGTPFTIQFPFGRNSHALMGLPFNYGNPFTITPTLVSGVWTYVTPKPMVYNYLQNINLRADGFPTPQNIEFLNNEGNDGSLNYSTLFAKIPVTAAPYENIWFNPQDIDQYVSLSIGKNSGIERVNFQLTDDFQNLLQCDYDWEAVFKVEVYEDKLIPSLIQGMNTFTADGGDKSFYSLFNTKTEDFKQHFQAAFNAGNFNEGNGSIFKDGPTSMIEQIRNGINKSADKLNEISGHIGVGGQIPIVMGASAGTIALAIGGAALTTLGGMETAAATTVAGMETAAASTIAGMETAATEISGAISTAIETAAAELVGVGEQEVAAEEELVAVEEQKVTAKAKTWVQTIKDTAAQFKEIVTAVKYVEDIALETKNAVKSLDELGKDMVGIKDDAQVAAEKAAEAAAAAAAKAEILHQEYRTDVSDFKQKFDSLVDKLDLENIDLSKLDIDLSKLDIDLSKLDLDLGELKNITAAIENKQIDMSPISDELEKISTTMDESRDIFSNVAVTIDESRDILSNVAVTMDESHVLLSNVAVTVDESLGNIVHIFKQDKHIFEAISSNFGALVRHLTGQHGAKESYQELIDELKKFIEESREKDVKPEVKTWISENKDIKYDPETSDKTSYNKLISTAVSLQQRIKYEPFESWIQKHREKV
jgi:hypothetical protein